MGRIRATLAIVALALLLVALPPRCLAGEEQWDEEYADGDASYSGDGGGEGGRDDMYADDAMAHEQYSERLQQQLESLRKEHDVSPPLLCAPHTYSSRSARSLSDPHSCKSHKPHITRHPGVQEIFGKGDTDKDGMMGLEEYMALHRQAEDDQGTYDQVEERRLTSHRTRDRTEGAPTALWTP